MGIMKCNTTDAIWILELRPSDHSGDGESSNNMFYLKAKFHLLSTNDI